MQKTVVFFGNSITEARKFSQHGWGYNVRRKFAQLSQQIRIINAGVSGDTTYLGLKRLQVDVIDHQPDLVTVEFGLNDCNYKSKNSPRVKLENFQRNYQKIITTLQKKTKSKIVLLANHPTTRTEKKMPNGKTYEENNQIYNQVIKKLAQRYQCYLIDLTEEFKREKQPLATFLSEDGLHLSARGNWLYGEIIFKHLKNILREREKLSPFYLYTDGASRGNPGPSAVGVILCNERGDKIAQHQKYIGWKTNNQAEYTALIEALSLVGKYSCEETKCFLDSELVVKQLTGQYRIKNRELQELFWQLKEKEKKLKKVSYCWVPRENKFIQLADQLVNQCLDEKTR